MTSDTAPKRRLTTSLPPGALAVGASLVAASATTYAFLAIAARTLGPERYAPLAVLWSLLFLAVPSLWTPVEQELVRRLSGRAVRGEGGRPVVVAAVRTALGIGGPALAVVTVGVVVGADAVFSGQVGVGFALVVAVAAFAPNHLTRAALASGGSFGRYGLCIAADSASRLALALVLVAIGVQSVLPFAAVVALAPLVPVVLFRRRWGAAALDGPPSESLTRWVLPLVAAQVLAQALVNGGPVLVAALATAEEDVVAGQFLAALLVARIPLFFFQAVQSSLLPRLAALEASGDRRGFVSQVHVLVALVSALGALAVALATTLGPSVVRLGFGADFELPGRDLGILALGAGAVMVAFVLAHAVTAVGAHRHVVAGWAVGVVTAVVTVSLGSALVWRVEVALAAGGLAAAATHAVILRDRLARWVERT